MISSYNAIGGAKGIPNAISGRKAPPAAELLKKAAKAEKGAANPLKDTVGQVTKAQIQEIAEIKMEDLNANDIAAAMKIVEGTARSMGIKVIE